MVVRNCPFWSTAVTHSKDEIRKRTLTKRAQQRARERARKDRRKEEKKKRREMNLHHRVPKAHGGSDREPNVVWVNIKTHRAWHLLFGIKPVLDVVQQMNRLWLPLDTCVIAVPTNRVHETLTLLHENGIVPSEDPGVFGVTPAHPTGQV